MFETTTWFEKVRSIRNGKRRSFKVRKTYYLENLFKFSTIANLFYRSYFYWKTLTFINFGHVFLNFRSQLLQACGQLGLIKVWLKTWKVFSCTSYCATRYKQKVLEVYFSTENKSTIDLDEFSKFKKLFNFASDRFCNCNVNRYWAVFFFIIAVNKSIV